MNFKEWLHTHEMRKPYQDYLARQFPDMPPTVRNELGTNTIVPNLKKMAASSPGMGLSNSSLADKRRALDKDSPTLAASPKPSPKSPYSSPDELMKNDEKVQAFQNADWKENPEKVTLRFDDFSERTKATMLHWRFGLDNRKNKKGHNLVRRHDQRMQDQQNLMKQRSVDEMEPVIMLREDDGKYHLLEGWHRTFNFLLATMTAEQKATVADKRIEPQDLPSHIDLTNPITILAYVGIPKQQQQQQQQRSPDYDLPTIDMPGYSNSQYAVTV
jgi:hypothetical protein